VAEIRGVEFIDDSKATNVGAAVRSLAAIEAPIIWIAGGRHKGGDLGELADAARGRIRRALLIGEAAEEFERTLAEQVGCERVADLAAAVARAMAIAHPGDVVLLAPACASFDQFKNFEDRGRQFQAAVHALAGDRGER
jgi:UDP-N-acetylmuramoylalanine--D-glutamate ligase